DAPEAWELTRGSPEVRVGVLDTGIAAGHPDLQPNMLSGFGAIGREDAFLDDAGLGHGTPVAAILGAVGDNDFGIAGINWNVSLLAMKVCDASGRCPYGAIARGVEEAVARGA